MNIIEKENLKAGDKIKFFDGHHWQEGEVSRVVHEVITVIDSIGQKWYLQIYNTNIERL